MSGSLMRQLDKYVKMVNNLTAKEDELNDKISELEKELESKSAKGVDRSEFWKWYYRQDLPLDVNSVFDYFTTQSANHSSQEQPLKLTPKELIISIKSVLYEHNHVVPFSEKTKEAFDNFISAILANKIENQNELDSNPLHVSETGNSAIRKAQKGIEPYLPKSLRDKIKENEDSLTDYMHQLQSKFEYLSYTIKDDVIYAEMEEECTEDLDSGDISDMAREMAHDMVKDIPQLKVKDAYSHRCKYIIIEFELAKPTQSKDSDASVEKSQVEQLEEEFINNYKDQLKGFLLDSFEPDYFKLKEAIQREIAKKIFHAYGIGFIGKAKYRNDFDEWFNNHYQTTLKLKSDE